MCTSRRSENKDAITRFCSEVWDLGSSRSTIPDNERSQVTGSLTALRLVGLWSKLNGNRRLEVHHSLSCIAYLYKNMFVMFTAKKELMWKVHCVHPTSKHVHAITKDLSIISIRHRKMLIPIHALDINKIYSITSI